MLTEALVDRRPIVSGAATIVIARKELDGTLHFGRMEYTTSRGLTSVRHPTETVEEGESMLQTLQACVLHEIARDAGNFKYRIDQFQPIFLRLGDDYSNPEGRHLKVAYLLERYAGPLRDFPKQDGNELLGPITEVLAHDYVKETKGNTVEYHYQCTMAALSTLAVDRRVWDKHLGLIGSWVPPELSEKDMKLAHDFFSR